ncbi:MULTISPECIES: ABC transporter substrate-binding protein [unclassified Acidovorax]|uniref:ABC transporter substrate-binding protein n=1 Tax=unclassified Acidovorax TaxID=2684926 RepID=UPI000A6747C0|nr:MULTISPECIES: ABC transporter substrate-binding protein [unclassified Acidovorax]
MRGSVAAASLALCAGTCAQAADKPPIVVGAVSSLSGPGASSASVQAARAYFDTVNAAGGIQGRRIDYTVVDDQMRPDVARQGAAALIDDVRVVALAGGSSVLECGVNHARYAQARLFNLPGAGVDPACFASSHIAPMNAGPYVSTANALTFVHQVLQRARICVVSPALPGMTDAFTQAVNDWSRRMKAATPSLDVYRLEDALPAVVQRVAARQCQAVVYTGPEGPSLAWMRESHPALAGIPVVLLTASYTSHTARWLSDLATTEAIYAMAEFDPWSSSSMQTTDWRRLLVASQIEPSSLSQGGYIAARALVQVMRGMEVPITRASVAETLERTTLWSGGMMAHPLRVAADGRHALNRSALPMRLIDGKWRVAHHGWITD